MQTSRPAILICTGIVSSLALISCCKPCAVEARSGTPKAEQSPALVAGASFPHFDEKGFITLSPGQSIILAGGQTALVPFGTTVVFPAATPGSANILGQKNTVHAFPGTIVAVPINAFGPADNVVFAKPIPLPQVTKPNQSVDPTPTAVTPPAGQEARHL